MDIHSCTCRSADARSVMKMLTPTVVEAATHQAWKNMTSECSILSELALEIDNSTRIPSEI
jgi:hypothetical protein